MADINRGGRPPRARGAPNSSDAGDARWTVRGVPGNVRAMAVKGAAARGMTVGDWLAEAVIAYARGTHASDDTLVSADSTAVAIPEDLGAVLRGIHERLAAVEKRRSIFGGLFKKAA